MDCTYFTDEGENPVSTETSLTIGERKKLAECEKTIESGLQSFVEVGKALVTIRDESLYTDVANDFDSYCKKRWNIGRHRAYQLIDSAAVVDNLSTLDVDIQPKNEAQARILSAIPDAGKQADVWTKAVETAPKGNDGKPKVTAAHVRKVAAEVAPKEAPKPKPAQGKESAPTAKLKTVESAIGGVMRQIDALHREYPWPAHDGLIDDCKRIQTRVMEWGT